MLKIQPLFPHLIEILLCAALAGCVDKDATKPNPSSAPASTGTTKPQPKTQTVEVRLNGKAVAKGSPEELIKRRPLAEFLPGRARDPGGWKWLRARGRERQYFNVVNPQKKFRDARVELFPIDEYAVGLGVFRTDSKSLGPGARARLGVPSTSIRNVATVDVWTVEPPKPVQKPATEGFELRIGKSGKPFRMTLEELRKIPGLTKKGSEARSRPHSQGSEGGASSGTSKEKGRGKNRRRGTQRKPVWLLTDILSRHCTLSQIASLRALGGGEPLVLEAKTLAENEVRLKLSGRKGLRLEWGSGDDKRRISFLRELIVSMKP